MPYLFEELLDDIATKVARNLDVVDEDIITMDNVVSYLVKQKALNPEVKKSAVSITEEKDVDHSTNSRKLVFIQMLLDADSKPLKKSEKSYQGRTLYVNGMDSELQQWLGGQASKILEF